MPHENAASGRVEHSTRDARVRLAGPEGFALLLLGDALFLERRVLEELSGDLLGPAGHTGGDALDGRLQALLVLLFFV